MLNQRAQQAASALDSLIEVEHQQTAFELAACGLGDVIATRAVMAKMRQHLQRIQR